MMSDRQDKLHAVFHAVGKRFRQDEGDSRIGFEEWNLINVESIEELIKKTLKAGFKLAEEEYECYAWFAAEYTDGQEMPSGTIAVELPLGPHDCSGPQWTFSLDEIIERTIEFAEEGEGGPIEPGSHKFFIEVRDKFRDLADTLDAALNRKTSDAPER